MMPIGHQPCAGRRARAVADIPTNLRADETMTNQSSAPNHVKSCLVPRTRSRYQESKGKEISTCLPEYHVVAVPYVQRKVATSGKCLLSPWPCISYQASLPRRMGAPWLVLPRARPSVDYLVLHFTWACGFNAARLCESSRTPSYSLCNS
jgi:hypothetical protein